MTAAAVEAGKVDIGRVIGDTFKVLGRNFVTFFLLSLILVGLPTGALAYVQGLFIGSDLTEFSTDLVLWSLLGALVTLTTTAILQGSLIYATVQDMNGAKPSVGDSLATGLRSFLPLILVSILFAIALTVGFILLIVPGVMLVVAWSVALPALVADRTGIFGSFGRSAELTRGNRWRIFGLLLISWIAFVVFSLVLGAITGVNLLTAGTDPEAMRDTVFGPVTIGLNVLSQTLTYMVASTGIAVLYVELRKARDGLGPQWLADIFG
jgi:MFS family permease